MANDRELLREVLGTLVTLTRQLGDVRRTQGIHTAMLARLVKGQAQEQIDMASNRELLNQIESGVAGMKDPLAAVELVVTNQNSRIQQLVDQLKADGADTAELQSLLDTVNANSARLAALALQGTPADTGTPVPAPVEPQQSTGATG